MPWILSFLRCFAEGSWHRLWNSSLLGTTFNFTRTSWVSGFVQYRNRQLILGPCAGHFYLTTLLLPTLLSTAKTNEDGKARVVNTASSAHYVARADPLNFDTFIDGSARWKYTTEDMYCQSKFVCVTLFDFVSWGSCQVCNYARPTSSSQTNSRDGTGIMVLSRHRSIQVRVCLTHWIIQLSRLDD